MAFKLLSSAISTPLSLKSLPPGWGEGRGVLFSYWRLAHKNIDQTKVNSQSWILATDQIWGQLRAVT